MIHTSRRQLLAGAAVLGTGFAASSAFAAGKVDLSDLATAPKEGDMSVGPDDAKVTIIEYGSASYAEFRRVAAYGRR